MSVSVSRSRRWLVLAVICALAAALLALLAGCSSISSGKVIDKSYVPGHYYTYNQPVYTDDCTYSSASHADDCYQVVSGYIPEQLWEGPSWQLELRNEQQTGWVDVTSGTYQAVRIGQHWSKP